MKWTRRQDGKYVSGCGRFVISRHDIDDRASGGARETQWFICVDGRQEWIEHRLRDAKSYVGRYYEDAA